MEQNEEAVCTISKDSNISYQYLETQKESAKNCYS